MGKLKRIDSFDINYADSFARRALKVVESYVHTDGTLAKKGSGEKRLYVGNDEAYLDSFFQFDQKPKFFIQKQDLQDYYQDALAEIQNPSFQYGENDLEVKQIFLDYESKLKLLQEDRLFFYFQKTYDRQHRYYLVLEKGNENKVNYDYIRDICLPRVSKLLFVKFYDDTSHQFYIYIKPVIWHKFEVESNVYNVSIVNTPKTSTKRNYREGQDKYREAILKKYPYCVVTGVTDPDLLIACHIKDYVKSTNEEKYDPNNGLTMTPTIHTLFDIGYLSFNMQGEMILSDFFRNMDRRRLNLDGKIRVALTKENLKYLEWHNQYVFRTPNASAYIM